MEQRRMLEELRQAAYDGDVVRVRKLVARGANPNVSALPWACKRSRLPVVEYLIGEAQVDANKQSYLGFTALHFACGVVTDALPVVRYLIETGGANIEARNDSGQTPLHSAASNLVPNTVRFLVEERLANVNATDTHGRTPLDEAICTEMDEWEQHSRENVIRYLLPRTSSVAEEALRTFWINESVVDIRGLLLEKYALGRGLANAFRLYPIHTLLKEFPLGSPTAFRDSIKLFPSSVLSQQDEEGCLPLHVALTSRNAKVKSPSVVALLFEREPRSALARDPSTGLYPHETAASLLSNNDDEDDGWRHRNSESRGECWLDIVYMMFRWNPQRLLLQSRSDSERRSTDEEGDEYNVVGRQTAKRQKTQHEKFH